LRVSATDPLDDKMVDPDDADIEGLLLGFLKVADGHIQQSSVGARLRSVTAGRQQIRG
jgi:hypothetical protein